MKYKGSCHCAAITFAFEHDEIKNGVRCNCSLCRRKGALMAAFLLAPEELQIVAKDGSLGLYQFGQKIAKHYFCKICGIYPFHETRRKPGHFRVNLGCIDEIDLEAVSVETVDGKSIK